MCIRDRTSIDDDSDDNDNVDMLDLSAIEPVVVMKRTKLRRVQLLSDSSDDEEGTDQNRNTTLHLSDDDDEVAQNIDQNQCLSIKNSSQNNSEQTTSNNKQPSDGPVRKYKFRKIHSTTSTITKPCLLYTSPSPRDRG